MLIVAAIVLLKIINSNYSYHVDVTTGKRNFNAAILALRRCSLEDNDNYGRASKILGQLWSLHRSGPASKEDAMSLRVESRLGASILHDILWTWRKVFGGQGNRSDQGTLDSHIVFLKLYLLTLSLKLDQEKAPQPDRAHTGTGTLTPNIMGEPSSSLARLDDTNWKWDLGLPPFTFIEIDSMAPSSSYM
jgi:hypothetical protein